LIHNAGDLTPETKVKDLFDDGWKMVSPDQQERNRNFYERKKLSSSDKRNFTQLNDKECSIIVKNLTLPQAGTLLSMFAYMEQGGDGFLYFNGKELSLKDFSGLIKKGYASTKRNVSELVNLGYVTAHKKGRQVLYSVNSQIATRGKTTTKGFFSRLFIVQLREVIKQASIQELGLFLFLLPYFNTRAYVVCSTPHELDVNDIKLLNREDIAEETGLSLPTVKRLIPSMMRKGLLTGVKTWRTAIVVHPKLVSRDRRKVTLEDVTEVIENELNKKREW